MKKQFILALFSLITLFSFSQKLDTKKLDAYFKILEENNKFMGSVSILKEGEIVYKKSTGFAIVETKKKNNENTKFRIGSISKTFTSVLIFKAIEEKKLKLDQNLSEFYPTIKNAAKISISNLLNHRSGIFNFTNDNEYLSYNTRAKTEKELIEIIQKGGSVFEPNSKAKYSNSNYVLLSLILQKVYKKKYAELLKLKIITPLGLKNTQFGKKIDTSKNECYSYLLNGKTWQKESETDMSIPLGAGGIISTSVDLNLFAQGLFLYKLISKESVNMMKELIENFGRGLFLMPFNEKISYGHSGGIDKFTSFFGYFPKEKTGFSVLSNSSNYNNNNISIVLLSALFNKEYELPSFKTVELTSKDLDKYLGIYSSETFPLKITITKDANLLKAQATGQPSFSLETAEKDVFKYDLAGIVLKFNPEKNEMTLKQGGGVFVLKK